MKLLNLCVLSTLVVWPLSLLMNNSYDNFLNYFVPSLLIGIYLYLHYFKSIDANLLILIIPFINSHLLVLPIIYFILLLIFHKNKRISSLYLFFAFIIFVWKYNSFFGHTIFQPDYQSRQEILRNITLYPNIPLARLFQNKLIIVANNFWNNLFLLIDPNNYFFGFAPRQIVGYQNLIKFPFMAIVMFIFYLISYKHKSSNNILIFISIAIITNLALLQNFDKVDITLWIPIATILYYGLVNFSGFKYSNIYLVLYLVISTIQIIRIFITH